ncbi:MAG: sugar ABC transporter substrate-binding protein [Deltaproteobacteria bacterium]|nr:sugar ABC transporter substrate-binding protein [Deltaproteobacteria bacterium]MBW2051139.1 sugar ABC transporter substrate-binding protein [Deltaproteobacteria bacterium]MBW2139932.1 sugar ABC transporter substrate-binding protein [Deltaproteobacteria bacterium]MBW2324008.1 sugar ABC transporter substrate-binding protein [Deltaproteobacteria bacterium]
MKSGNITKSVFIALVAGVLFLSFSITALAAPDFNWRKYEGTTIRVLAGKSAYTPIAQKHTKDFEKLTGIRVIAEYYPSAQLRRKLLMELGAKNKDLDVFGGMMKTNFQYHNAGWLETLDKYIKDPSLTSPDFDYEDYYPRVRSVINGQTIGITGSCNPQVLMYRKDLFEKYNIKVPANWEELEAAAKKLTLDTNGDGKTDIYGWIARMNQENTAPFANFIYSNGARYLDENRKPVFNSPEFVEGVKFYGRLMRNYGPPGGATIGWKEVIGAFAQGRAAMTVEISIFAYLVLENPKSSKVAGKVGYALFPPGKPGMQITMMPCNTQHINNYSQKKEAAWYYLQYMNSKKVALDYKLKGAVVARRSTWQDPKWKAADRFPELTKIMLNAFDNGLVGFEIPIAGFVEARKHLSQLVFTGYEDGDVQKVADETVKVVEEIMKRTEK